jgi:hypothetical protein
MKRLAILLLTLSMTDLSTACVHARAIPIGSAAPSRPSDCELAYERASPRDAQAQWRQVGDACVDAHSVDVVYQPGSQHDALTEQACSLGGQIVTPVGLCSNGRHSAIEFGVYVSR